MRNNITNIKTLFIHKDVFTNIFVGIMWGYMLLNYVRGVVNHLPFLNNYTDEIERTCVILPLILSLPNLLNKFAVFDYLFYVFLAALYFLNYALHPENTNYLNENIYTCLCIATPMYFIGRIMDIEKYFKLMTIISIICIYISFYYFLHYAQSAKNMSEVAGDDNMHTAYMLLPHILLLTWNSLKKINIFYIITSILGVIFLFSCGTRGPLVCFGFFFLTYFLFFMNFPHAYIIKGIIVSLCFILIYFLHTIIEFLIHTFTDFQLSTRILDKFIDGELGNDSGRGAIKIALKRYLDTYGDFTGLGYFGSKRFGYIYPHDLILDFQISYGYIIGTLLLIAITLLLCYALYASKTKMEKCFIFLLISFTILKYLLSSTFITEMYFYFLIGYCIRIMINNKKITLYGNK